MVHKPKKGSFSPLPPRPRGVCSPVWAVPLELFLLKDLDATLIHLVIILGQNRPPRAPNETVLTVF